jgi:small subunit ribosomal protein S10e
MLISKKTRIAVYSYLFKEGTMVVHKDRQSPKHSDELPISNLEVMCLLRSFASKGYVNMTFNWGYYYYYLTNEGIDFLRQYLALPSDIVPATLKASAAAPQAAEGKKSAPGEFKPEFSREKRDGYRK